MGWIGQQESDLTREGRSLDYMHDDVNEWVFSEWTSDTDGKYGTIA